MKYLIAILLAFASVTASAQHYRDYGHRHHGHRPAHHWVPGHGWVVPSIIGGVLVYEVMKSRPQQTIIVEQPTQTQTCTEWKEIITAEGKVYRERTCTTP